MRQTLNEAGFLTINLNNLNNKNKAETTTSTDSSNVTLDDPKELGSSKVTNWSAEFNAVKNSSKQEQEAFWENYFTANWQDSTVSKHLISLGDYLRNLITVLGFSPRKNPIIKFLKLNYVQNKLIKTKLIDEANFSVIYSAIAKRLVASSEFTKDNNYNILYCPDWYIHSPTDMLKYLQKQATVLNPSNTDGYTDADKAKNLTMLFKEGTTSVKNAKLKKISETNIPGTAKPKATTTTINNFVAKLASTAEIQAVLQYISMSTTGEIANKALATTVFDGASKDLVLATKSVAKLVNAFEITDKNAEELYTALIARAKALNK